MTVRSRETKVLVTLMVSILIGAAILSALGHNPPSAGAFCLSRYYSLSPVEKSLSYPADQYSKEWKWIEIYYSTIEHKDMDCHLIICNGHIGDDGQILSTDNWQRQRPVNRQLQNHIWSATEKGHTIYICIITRGKGTPPTDFQVSRTESLVEELRRRFSIQSESVLYPNNWR
ncbi:MAG: N-acetylmuramoyl-L-alanine amidase [Phycisphaerales bacterium]|nr:MAG: N-acetylmuramoyl-L-alanine amidase [Phycisphaerales bacterium]